MESLIVLFKSLYFSKEKRKKEKLYFSINVHLSLLFIHPARLPSERRQSAVFDEGHEQARIRRALLCWERLRESASFFYSSVLQAFEELEELLGKHNICIAIKEKLVKDSGVAEEIAYDTIVRKLLTKPRARGKNKDLLRITQIRSIRARKYARGVVHFIARKRFS